MQLANTAFRRSRVALIAVESSSKSASTSTLTSTRAAVGGKKHLD